PNIESTPENNAAATPTPMLRRSRMFALAVSAYLTVSPIFLSLVRRALRVLVVQKPNVRPKPHAAATSSHSEPRARGAPRPGWLPRTDPSLTGSRFSPTAENDRLSRGSRALPPVPSAQ